MINNNNNNNNSLFSFFLQFITFVLFYCDEFEKWMFHKAYWPVPLGVILGVIQIRDLGGIQI